MSLSSPHPDFRRETEDGGFWADDEKGQVGYVSVVAGSWSWVVYDDHGCIIGGRRSWGMDFMKAAEEALKCMRGTR
jgi:hypothetical protein